MAKHPLTATRLLAIVGLPFAALMAAPAGIHDAVRLPTVSPDRKYLFVCRGAQAWWADARVIEERRPKQ